MSDKLIKDQNMKKLLFATIIIITCGNAYGQYIAEDLSITEERFTGVWARLSITGAYTEIIWFKEPGKFGSDSFRGQITVDQLKQYMAYHNSDTAIYPEELRSESGLRIYLYRVEIIGRCVMWEEDRYRTTGPFDYRFEGNKLFFSGFGQADRPYTKVELD